MENMSQKASQKLDEIKVAEMGVAATKPDIPAVPSFHDYCKQLAQQYLVEEILPDFLCNWSTDESYIDLESGLKTKELVCNCKGPWIEKCPKCDSDVRSLTDVMRSIVKEFKFLPAEKKLKENGYAVNLVETVKKLKDEGCELLCIPVEIVNEFNDNLYALKFIPVEAVEVRKDDDPALKFIPVETVQKKEDGYALFISVKMAKGLKDGTIDEVVSKSSRKRFGEWLKNANDYIEKTMRPEMGILFSGATMQNIYQLLSSGMLTTGKGKTLMKLNEAAFMMLLYGHVMPRRAAGHIALAIGVTLASAAYLVTMSFAF